MKEITRHRRASLLTRVVGLAALTLVTGTSAVSQDWKMLFGLRGDWKFELGDDKRWAEKTFNDSQWETIFAPAHWEDEGFPGYDGYAWYRKHFQATNEWKGKTLFLRLGHIDDVDEVYVNGKFVGQMGNFPPHYETAYNLERRYEIPAAFLNIPGDNLVAVRVYDDELAGGLADGRLGIYEDGNTIVPDIPLAGEWKFMTGDDSAWKETNADDMQWSKILVPSYWEPQGFFNYDGYAWYRLQFQVPRQFAERRMVLLLGTIDDFDETYLNGTLIGKTGVMGRRVELGRSDEWQQLRAYTITPGQLRAGENVVAVRVYDGYRDGGIYRGPIGLVTREQFMKWDKAKRDFEEGWKDFMKDVMKGFKIDIE